MEQVGTKVCPARIRRFCQGRDDAAGLPDRFRYFQRWYGVADERGADWVTESPLCVDFQCSDEDGRVQRGSMIVLIDAR